MHILAAPVHPQSLKKGMIRGDCFRYLTHYTMSIKFERAWKKL